MKVESLRVPLVIPEVTTGHLNLIDVALIQANVTIHYLERITCASCTVGHLSVYTLLT